jgi:hypothetical protein
MFTVYCLSLGGAELLPLPPLAGGILPTLAGPYISIQVTFVDKINNSFEEDNRPED